MNDQSRTPSRREVIRPWELVLGSGIASLFASIIVFAGTHDWQLTSIVFGLLFIVTLMSLAMFVLAIKPKREELAEIDEQNHSA